MYSNLPIGTRNPGLIVILIDQSDSMRDAFGGTTKMDFAALAVNRCIYEIISNCTAGEKIKDRCHIGVIGYGDSTQILTGGKPSALQQQVKRIEKMKKKVSDGAGGVVEVDQTMPIWVNADASGGTPMHEGFKMAADLVEAWIGENGTNFPPIVINITDGVPDAPVMAVNSANRLLAMGTADGATLLLNAHISETGQREVVLPEQPEALADDFGRMLFSISSPLPDPMMAAAQNAGFSPGPSSRGMVMNASAETLTKLIVFGSAPAQAR